MKSKTLVRTEKSEGKIKDLITVEFSSTEFHCNDTVKMLNEKVRIINLKMSNQLYSCHSAVVISHDV